MTTATHLETQLKIAERQLRDLERTQQSQLGREPRNAKRLETAVDEQRALVETVRTKLEEATRPASTTLTLEAALLLDRARTALEDAVSDEATAVSDLANAQAWHVAHNCDSTSSSVDRARTDLVNAKLETLKLAALVAKLT